jgi:hypothetical protein
VAAKESAKTRPQSQLTLLFRPAPRWRRVLANDARCRELAERHYPRRRRGMPAMHEGARPLGPGFCILLHHEDAGGEATWGVVLNRFDGRWFWRNSLYRNEAAARSSSLVEAATALTYELWIDEYGSLPDLLLRTEIDIEETQKRRSKRHEPGHCYREAGWIEESRRDWYKGRPPTVYLEHPR